GGVYRHRTDARRLGVPAGNQRGEHMTAETSADRPISRFEVPKIDDLPADIAERIRQVEDKTGFVPNVFLALGHRPEEWRAFFAYHDALMDKETPALSKADRELS